MTAPFSTSTTTPSLVRSRLADLGIDLPTAVAPNYTYEPVTVWGDIAFVSGQIPRRDGGVVRGTLGVDRDLEEAQGAAALCVLGALAQLEAAVGLDRVAQVLKLTVYVASAPDVVTQPLAAEGASRTLVDAFGERGRHSRTALGVPRLPADALLEIDLVVGLHRA